MCWMIYVFFSPEESNFWHLMEIPSGWLDSSLLESSLLTFSFPRQLFTKLASWSHVVRLCQELQARACVVSMLHKHSGGSFGKGTGCSTSFRGTYQKLLFPSQNSSSHCLAVPLLKEEEDLLQQFRSIGGIGSSCNWALRAGHESVKSSKGTNWRFQWIVWNTDSQDDRTSGMSDCATMAQASCGLLIYSDLDRSLYRLLFSAAVPGM